MTGRVLLLTVAFLLVSAPGALGTHDSTAPETTITSGPSGTETTNSGSFSFVSSETGSTFECRLDGYPGGNWSQCESPWSFSLLADGEHYFEVRATDSEGNTDPSPAAQTWFIDSAESDTIDSSRRHPVVVVDDGIWHLRGDYSSGPPSASWTYGKQSDVPFFGDWNGDGTATPGIYRNGWWYLRNSNSSGIADIKFYYGGHPGDIPVVGDWNGDGHDNAGIIRGGEWHLVYSHRGGAADKTFVYGRIGPRGDDIPLVGAWGTSCRTGGDCIGIVRDGAWHIKFDTTGGAADVVFTYGRVGPRGDDIPVTGDWNGDGADTVGIVRGDTWYLRDKLAGGPADRTFQYGAATDWKTIQGGYGDTTQRRIIGQ